MSAPEYFLLFSTEGDFAVEVPGVPVAPKRVSARALADLMSAPPRTMFFDEHLHEVQRYELVGPAKPSQPP